MFALSLAVAALTINAQDQTVVTDAATVSLLGQSGGIRLTPVNTDKWIKLSWEKAEEIDTSGKVVASINNLASQSFAWTAPVTENNDDDVPVTTLSFTSTFGNGAQWEIDVIVVQDTTTVQVADPVEEGAEQTFTGVEVPDNAVEFVVKVTNWPFASQDNVLRFGAEVHTQKGQKASKEDEASFDQISSADYAKVTGLSDVRVLTNTEVKNGKATVFWTFPYFPAGTTLVFDPLLSGANTAAPSLALLGMLGYMLF